MVYNARNSSSFVIMRLDVQPGETLESGEWQNRNTIPLLARIKKLPNKIGAHQTDNGHAELAAACMVEEAIHPDMAAVIIMDSLSTLGLCRALRDGIVTSDRDLIRNKYSGASKAYANRLAKGLAEWSAPTRKIQEEGVRATRDRMSDEHFENWDDQMQAYMNHEEDDEGEENPWYLDDLDESEETDIFVPYYQYKDKDQVLVDDRPLLPPEFYNEEKKNTTAEALALLHKRQEQWVSMDDAKPYKKVYTDAHPHRQYIKADSHQMNDDYKPKKPGRYRYLTPNKAVVHANQTADTAASIGIASYENKTFQHTIFPDPILMDLHA